MRVCPRNAITSVSQVIQDCSKLVNMQKHSVVFFLRMSDILTLTTLTEDSASGSSLPNELNALCKAG